jgi:HEAT repeats
MRWLADEMPTTSFSLIIVEATFFQTVGVGLMETTAPVIAVVALVAGIVIVAFLIFRKHRPIELKSPRDTGLQIDASNKAATPTPGGVQAVEPLTAALSDSDWRARRNAAESLGKMGDGQAVEPLTIALRDADRQVRRNAVLLQKLDGFGKRVGEGEVN